MKHAWTITLLLSIHTCRSFTTHSSHLPSYHRSSYTQHDATMTTPEPTTPSTPTGPPAIIIDSLSCSHDGGETYQLNSASYILPRYSRIGLVGRNGCGKSTFFKILMNECGLLPSGAMDGVKYSGGVEMGKGTRVAFVEQEPPSPIGVSVSDALLGMLEGVPAGVTSNAYEAVRAYLSVTSAPELDDDQFAKASADMDNFNGWDIFTTQDEISTKLRISHLTSKPLSDLSGGERKRVALAAALIQSPDVLLLDEPTNHLDLAAIRWLSDLLRSRTKLTTLVVTHDRAFLEDVCTGILELDRGSFYNYDSTGGRGGYSGYLQQKADRLLLEDQSLRSGKKKLGRELEWMRRQPQARASKSKARIEAFYKLEKMVKPRVVDPSLEIEGGQRRIGKSILKLNNVSLKYNDDKIILDDFSYNFNGGDKIGVVGANGVGKSTFLSILTGNQPIDNGSVETGETVVFGKYDQMGITVASESDPKTSATATNTVGTDVVTIDESETVLNFVKQRVTSRKGVALAEAPGEAMKLLQRFEFSRDRWSQRISMLSGGERRRLQLLSVITQRPNFLILDEPTNDVDLDTLSALERYLAEFTGVLVVVSHDRFFTDKVTDHLFVFEGNGIVKDYLGSLTDYAECLVENESADPSSDGGAPPPVAGAAKGNYKQEKEKRLGKKKEHQKLQKEIQSLEKRMDKLRAKIDTLQTEMDETSSDNSEGWTVLADLSAKIQEATDEIDETEMRWLEVAEVLETLNEDEE